MKWFEPESLYFLKQSLYTARTFTSIIRCWVEVITFTTWAPEASWFIDTVSSSGAKPRTVVGSCLTFVDICKKKRKLPYSVQELCGRTCMYNLYQIHSWVLHNLHCTDMLPEICTFHSHRGEYIQLQKYNIAITIIYIGMSKIYF